MGKCACTILVPLRLYYFCCCMRLIDLTGQKFGRLTVIERAESENGQTRWLCECECGNKKAVISSHLQRGYTKSCGCLNREMVIDRNRKHGHRGDRIYYIWCAMKRRCCVSSSPKYDYYGGRGITVCEEWLHDFQAFYDWAVANGYRDDLTIDRIDNDKGYSPDNCRWVTNKEQQNNKRNVRELTYNGKTQTISQWANETKIPHKKIWSRISRLHWSVEKALTTK